MKNSRRISPSEIIQRIFNELKVNPEYGELDRTTTHHSITQRITRRQISYVISKTFSKEKDIQSLLQNLGHHRRRKDVLFLKLPHWDRADWIDPFNLLSERPNVERNIKEEDTILILSREGQRNYFDKCSRSNSCVALDATHNTSRYDLKLLSVHALNPRRKGVPIIYGFLSRETTELVQLVLASITDCTNTGGKNVSTIISDDDNSSFAAVSQEWPHVEHMFLCHFHLIKRLKEHLARSNISKTQKESVLHNFYKLMYQSLESEEVDTISLSAEKALIKRGRRGANEKGMTSQR